MPTPRQPQDAPQPPAEPLVTVTPETPAVAPADPSAPPAPEAAAETAPTVREEQRPPLVDVAADRYNAVMARASANTRKPADAPEEE